MKLCEYINSSRSLLVTHAAPQNIDIIRVAICQERLTKKDINESWRILLNLINEFFTKGSYYFFKPKF